MRAFNIACLVVALMLFGVGAFVRFCCPCGWPVDLYCFKCGHWSSQCPRFAH